MEFVKVESLRAGFSEPPYLVLDTLTLCQSLLPQGLEAGGPLNNRLQTLSEYFGFGGDGYHRALADSVYTEVRCYSTVIESTYAPQTSNPNEGRLFGQYLAPGAAVAGAPSSEISRPLPLRRLTFADSERYNPERARARALWRWQQGIFAAASLTYKVQGISQGGKLYTTNVQAEARDGYNGLDRTMFVSRVELRQDESGTSTVVTLKPSGLYFA